jgi:hypothetical protein
MFSRSGTRRSSHSQPSFARAFPLVQNAQQMQVSRISGDKEDGEMTAAPEYSTTLNSFLVVQPGRVFVPVKRRWELLDYGSRYLATHS